MHMTSSSDVARIVHAFRQAVPMARAVILATDDGQCLAHDLPADVDPQEAAREALWERRLVLADAEARGRAPPASAFVEGPQGLTLVVFVPGATLAVDFEGDTDPRVARWTAEDLGETLAHALTAA